MAGCTVTPKYTFKVGDRAWLDVGDTPVEVVVYAVQDSGYIVEGISDSPTLGTPELFDTRAECAWHCVLQRLRMLRVNATLNIRGLQQKIHELERNRRGIEALEELVRTEFAKNGEENPDG